MLGPVSQRILTVLQLTRMALVFTAIADGAAEVLLRAASSGTPVHWDALDMARLMAMAVTSIGLYGFGMSLNDIIDHRRDSRLAAHRPLPSGRIALHTAHAVCAGLGLLALAGGLAYARLTMATGHISLILLLATGGFIAFYDFSGKYLVAPGLLSLGVIRFLNATIAAPHLPIVWHPLLLLDHVAILSAVAYHWEEKRPPLRRLHWWWVLGGVAALNLLVLALVGWQRGDETLAGSIHALKFQPALLFPAAAIIVFLIIGYIVRRRNPISREAGQKLMLYGLLWLIVYDSVFVAGFVGWKSALGVLALLPISWWSVQLMRWWNNLLSLSQRPEFQRART